MKSSSDMPSFFLTYMVAENALGTMMDSLMMLPTVSEARHDACRLVIDYSLG